MEHINQYTTKHYDDITCFKKLADVYDEIKDFFLMTSYTNTSYGTQHKLVMKGYCRSDNTEPEITFELSDKIGSYRIDDYIVKVRKTRNLSTLSKLAASRNMSGLSSAIVLGLPENVLRFGVAAAVCVL